MALFKKDRGPAGHAITPQELLQSMLSSTKNIDAAFVSRAIDALAQLLVPPGTTAGDTQKAEAARIVHAAIAQQKAKPPAQKR